MNTIAQKIRVGTVIALFTTISFAMPAMATDVTYTPWAFLGTSAECGPSYYDATEQGAMTTEDTDGSLTLTKNDSTDSCSAAGATINNSPTKVTSLSFDVVAFCDEGSPRFNVYTPTHIYKFGCANGDANYNTVSFSAGHTYGDTDFPAEGITNVKGIDIVDDEQGTTTLSNIMVNNKSINYVSTPIVDKSCLYNGFSTITDLNGNTFLTQDQCVDYFEHLSYTTEDY